MKRLSIAVTGLALLMLGACSSEAVRTTETKNEVKEVVKINTEDGGDVKVWTLGEGVDTTTKVQAVAPSSDRDAYLARIENELKDLGDRVEGLRSRAGMRAKYTSARSRRMRGDVARLESELASARRDLAALRTKNDADFQNDRVRLDTKVAAVRADVDHVVAE